MTQPRIPETDHGIQGQFTVLMYDEMLRHLRDRGWVETSGIIRSGIARGHALEIGPGPGYLGLEWLKHTTGTTLTGLDISPDMVALARRNADLYNLAGRLEYRLGDGSRLPFDDSQFDAVFSNGSLHEWADPCGTFNEIWRVLKPGGRVFISDLRRDMAAGLRWLMWLTVRPVGMRPGLVTSLQASYTPRELDELKAPSGLRQCQVAGNVVGLSLSGAKARTAR
jgi:ubiquinone/menaquinone biosynthesis C-methylase UbiE